MIRHDGRWRRKLRRGKRGEAHGDNGPIGRIRRIGPILLAMLGLALFAPAVRAAAAPASAAKSPAAPSATAPVGALGQNLDYLRVREVPAGLAAAKPAPTGALVLDLRFATVGANDGFSVGTWLNSHARTNAPVFVLFNSATQPALLDALAPGYLPSGVITLAPSGTRLPPDITIDVDAATDRKAYEAYDQGTALTDLVVTTTAKQRFDETELIRRDAAADAGGKSAPARPPAAGTPPPLVDAVLQRAVQLHRSLLALGRIK